MRMPSGWGRRLLEGPGRPTAVLCFSDLIARGVLEAASTAGLAVPEDLTVVGFDDDPLAAAGRPALTTVRQDLAAKGQAAARALFDAMDAADSGTRRRLNARAAGDGAGGARHLGGAAGGVACAVTRSPSHPAWPSDRRTFVSLGLQSVVNAFVYSTYVARLPDIRDEAGLSIAAMGLVMTLGNLAGLAAMFPSGAVIRRWGSRRVMVWSSVLYVLALPAIGSSTSPAMLLAAIVAMMITNSLVDVAVAMQSASFSRRLLALSRHEPPVRPLQPRDDRGAAVATAVAAAGTDVTIHLLALAAVLAAALVLVSPGLLPVDERPDDRPARAQGAARPWSVVAVLGLASALAVPLDVVPGEWATFRVIDDLGGAPSQASLAFVAFTVGMTAGRLAGDRATARLGATRLLRGAVVRLDRPACCSPPSLPVPVIFMTPASCSRAWASRSSPRC